MTAASPGGGRPARWRHPGGDAYDQRWRDLAAAGQSVHGEADLVTGLAPSTVLDAGCGTGRVAIELARRGIDVVGVDRDPAMLETARRKAPDLLWYEVDLAHLDVRAQDGRPRQFDVVVAAGNVMIFLDPGTEAAVVSRLARHLAPGGALVTGFQLVPGGYSLADHDRDSRAAGLVLADRFATWEGHPFVDGGDYAVSVHRRG